MPPCRKLFQVSNQPLYGYVQVQKLSKMSYLGDGVYVCSELNQTAGGLEKSSLDGQMQRRAEVGLSLKNKCGKID